MNKLQKKKEELWDEYYHRSSHDDSLRIIVWAGILFFSFLFWYSMFVWIFE